MSFYKIRDVEQEKKLEIDEEIIAGIVGVKNEKISLVDGWKSIEDFVELKELSILTGEETKEGTEEKEGKVKLGEKGFFQAFKDLLVTQGFFVEEIKTKKEK